MPVTVTMDIVTIDTHVSAHSLQQTPLLLAGLFHIRLQEAVASSKQQAENISFILKLEFMHHCFCGPTNKNNIVA